MKAFQLFTPCSKFKTCTSREFINEVKRWRASKVSAARRRPRERASFPLTFSYSKIRRVRRWPTWLWRRWPFRCNCLDGSGTLSCGRATWGTPGTSWPAANQSLPTIKKHTTGKFNNIPQMEPCLRKLAHDLHSVKNQYSFETEDGIESSEIYIQISFKLEKKEILNVNCKAYMPFCVTNQPLMLYWVNWIK